MFFLIQYPQEKIQEKGKQNHSPFHAKEHGTPRKYAKNKGRKWKGDE